MSKQRKASITNVQSRLPAFASYQAEAEFWDTHDVTDYINESAPTLKPFGEVCSLGIMSPMDIFEVSVWRDIGDCAKKDGVDPPRLLQRWILERLAEERQRPASGNDEGA